MRTKNAGKWKRVIRRSMTLLLLLLVAFAAACRASSAEVDLAQLLKDKGVPSVAIAQIKDGKLLWAKVFGTQSPGVPATTNTLYNVASMTKPITAEVILRLASKQRLSLDETMDRFWVDPDLENDDRHKLLTPRLALSHQTGFPNWRYQTSQVLKFLRKPGESFGYSGEGYEYVARFAARKTGEDFERLAQALVFEPTGMSNTAYTKRAWFEGRIALPTESDGRYLEPKIGRTYSAADDLYTTIGDYTRFVVSVMNRESLDQGIARQRETIQVTRPNPFHPSKCEFCPDEMGMGLGWEVFRFKKDIYLMHTGSDAGTYALGYFSPTLRSGLVIFTNSSRGERVVLPILDRFGIDDPLARCMRAHMRK
jgi:CubicO group peptidase (beta-lactamase class C family)